MCMSMCTMYVPGIWKSEEVIRYPVTGPITWLLTIMWVLKIDSGSSVRATNIINL